MKILKKIQGQAILELALFGSILIMLLGAILSYGLRYSQQQKTMMSAFRKALQESTDPNSGGQANVTVISDKHIPIPTNPFAIGSVSPFVSSASVIRSARLHETADTLEELPKTTIQIQGQEFTYRTAGFRVVDMSSGSEKYKEVYGDANVDTDTGKIIDSCEGELMSYDGCKRQCRMITQTDFCVRECERGKEPDSSKDCNSVCSQTIETPWYCNSMDNIFSFAIAKNKPKAMGVQSNYTQTTITNNILQKQESAGTINTTDSINWQATTDRTIVYIDQAHNVQQTPVSKTVGENTTCVNAECN